MKSKILLFIGLMAVGVKPSAQQRWNLVKCIDFASKNNIGLAQSKIASEMAEVELMASKHSLLPDLSGSINGGISFGRNVDPTTNSFTTENILYSNYSLSSSVVLFQSGLMRNSVKKARMNVLASQEDFQQAFNDLGLTVATYYLNVLLAQERLEISKKGLDIQLLQLDQINKLIKTGMKPEADALEIQSQVARAEQSIVVAQNALDLAWLQLKQTLRLPPDESMELEKLTEDQLNRIQLEVYSYDQIAVNAEQQQASLRAAKHRLEAAKLSEKIARAAFYPALFANGSIGSRFSDAAIRPKTYGTERVLVPGVFIDGNAVQFEQEYPNVLTTEVIPFKTQFDQFLGYGVGVSLSIPIYRNYASKAGLRNAKLNTRMNDLNYQLKKEALDQNLYTAIANVKAAIKEQEAANKSFLAAQAAYDKTYKKFQIGAASSFELNLSQSNLQTSENNLVIAKYDLVFKQKLLDYYAGKKIEL